MWRLLQYDGAYDRLMAECDQAMKDAIKPRLAQVLIKGNLARYPVTEPLGDGLFEIRARAKKVRIRLLFGFSLRKRIVVVWGGTKDQRRLPPATIDAARRLLKEAEATIEKLHVINLH
jgi:phage-related protein